jgi:hypothetical protein
VTIDGVPFDQIEESHLRALLESPVPEGRTLDDKRDVYGPKENAEFAKDVSALVTWPTPAGSRPVATSNRMAAGNSARELDAAARPIAARARAEHELEDSHRKRAKHRPSGLGTAR